MERKFFTLFYLCVCLLVVLAFQPVTFAVPIPTNIQYVSPEGNDANDGLSWQTAKQTILAAYDALPEENYQGFGGGTIYFANASRIGGSISDQGLWILGPKDPNWNSPPPGWRRQKQLKLLGLPAANIANSAGMPQAWIIGGSNTNSNKPTIWIAGTDIPIHFENVAIMHPAVAIRLGVGSNGIRNVDTSTVSFYNVGAQVHNVAGSGPTVDIGYAYWIWFTRCVFSSNSAEPLSSDKRAAILVKPTAPAGVMAPSSGLLTISDCNFNTGGIKYYAGDSGWSLLVRNCVFEGDFVNPLPPPVHIVNANQYGNAYIESIMTADAPGDGSRCEN